MFQSVLEREVSGVAEAASTLAAGLDPDDVPASEAVRIYRSLDQACRSLAAAKTLLARRVDDSLEWQRKGFRNAAEFLADTSGTSLGAARAEVETSRALPQLPDTARQMTEGTISPQQGALIADAAKANPSAEQSLLDTARTANLHELRDEALKAKAAGDADPDETHARIRRERRLTRFTDGQGARHLHLQGPVDEVVIIEAEIDRRLSQIIRTGPTGEPLETRDAMAFDATVEVARRSEGADAPSSGIAKQARPQHLALLRLDIEALWRGYAEGDELCEVTGLGPIPVGVATRLLGDAVLKLIVTKGDAVAQVTSLTRGPTQAMRYALLWTSPTCCVEGCTRTIVEHDHAWGAEYKDTRHTRLDQLEPKCHTHHDLHTHHDWALLAGAGKRQMVPPEDPRHPCHGLPPPDEPTGAAPSRDPDAADRRPGEPPGPTRRARSTPPATEQTDLFSDPAA